MTTANADVFQFDIAQAKATLDSDGVGLPPHTYTSRSVFDYELRGLHGQSWTCFAPLEKLGSTLLLPLPVDADDTEWHLVEGDEFPDREIEVGFLFKRAAWGNGYATEACARLLQFAFEETPLAEVVAVIDPKNTGSRNVLLKCGLREVGLRRAYAEVCPGFRITRGEWQMTVG